MSESKKQNKFLNWIKSSKSDFLLFALLLLLVNLVAARAFLRLDLTKQRSYSLSAASKEVVKTIEEPLSVKVFFTKNLPAPYDSVEQYVKDILIEYKNAASKNFSYEIYNMDKKENQELAYDLGLYQSQVQLFKDNQATAEKVYMGLVITYADQIETINPVSSTSGLEYTITSTISSIINNTNILTGLKENLKLTLYKSSSLNDYGISGYNEVEDYVKEAVDAVNKKFHNKIEYAVKDPSSDEARKLNEEYGLSVLSYQDENGQTGYATLDLLLQLGEKFRVVPVSISETIFRTWMVTGIDNLEEDLENYIKQLVSKTSTIAYIANHGERDKDDTRNMSAVNFAGLLTDSYTLEEVDLLSKDIPSYVQSVIINGPRTQFSQEELYKIDQFLMKGGNLILFLDPFDEVENGNQYQMAAPSFVPVSTGLEAMLEKYGLKLNQEYVYDSNCYHEVNQQYGNLKFYYAPAVQDKQLAKHPVTDNLGFVLFVQSASIDTSGVDQNMVNVTNLVSSSKKSWTQKDGIYLSPLMISEPDTYTGPYQLAVLLEGKFNSAFAQAPEKTAAEPESESVESEGAAESRMSLNTHLSSSRQSGKIFLAGTSYITTQQLLSENSKEPVAYLLRNVVDYMNGNGDLCTMRTKGLSLNSLSVQKGPLVNFIKYFNEIGLALLVVLAGLIVFLKKKAHRNAIRMKYDPEDSREEKNNSKEN